MPPFARNIQINFPSIEDPRDSCGLAIDVDRGGNAYVGGYFEIDDPFFNWIRQNYTLQVIIPLDHITPAIVPWNFTIFNTNSACWQPNPEGGMYGVKFLGGTNNPNAGVYTTGIISDGGGVGCLNPLGPTKDNLILAKRDPGNGAPLYPSTGANGVWLWVANPPVGGKDFAGQEITVDRAGFAYVTGWTDFFTSSGNEDGFVMKVMNDGQFEVGSYAPIGGADGLTTTKGYGIDLVTSSPSSEILLAGLTETPDFRFQPFMTGCHRMHTAGVDGYIIKDDNMQWNAFGFWTANAY